LYLRPVVLQQNQDCSAPIHEVPDSPHDLTIRSSQHRRHPNPRTAQHSSPVCKPEEGVCLATHRTLRYRRAASIFNTKILCIGHSSRGSASASALVWLLLYRYKPGLWFERHIFSQEPLLPVVETNNLGDKRHQQSLPLSLSLSPPSSTSTLSFKFFVRLRRRRLRFRLLCFNNRLSFFQFLVLVHPETRLWTQIIDFGICARTKLAR
jgi:hypothetical protein